MTTRILALVLSAALWSVAAASEPPRTESIYARCPVEIYAAVLDLTTDPMTITAQPEYRVIVVFDGIEVNLDAAAKEAQRLGRDGVLSYNTEVGLVAAYYPPHRIQRVWFNRLECAATP